jgi:hypothetical protein
MVHLATLPPPCIQFLRRTIEQGYGEAFTFANTAVLGGKLKGSSPEVILSFLGRVVDYYAKCTADGSTYRNQVTKAMSERMVDSEEFE